MQTAIYCKNSIVNCFNIYLCYVSCTSVLLSTLPSHLLHNHNLPYHVATAQLKTAVMIKICSIRE